ncbi:MAG: response regulator [Spirochaetes bacterium]|nr:response regulator [Spirochaetota bacterium]
MKILVAEDDFGSRKMMQRFLESYGEVDVVVDGEEAVQAFKLSWEEQTPYSVIFMDIMMPKMDGHEAIKYIRAYEQLMSVSPVDEVKIVMATVLEDPKNVIEAYYKSGATSYLVKPIDRERLKEEMGRLGITEKAQ